jgi:hypothetical protein
MADLPKATQAQAAGKVKRPHFEGDMWRVAGDRGRVKGCASRGEENIEHRI